MRHRRSNTRGVLVAKGRACWIRFGDREKAAHGGSKQQQVENKSGEDAHPYEDYDLFHVKEEDEKKATVHTMRLQKSALSPDDLFVK